MTEPDPARIVGIIEHRDQLFVATEDGLYRLEGEGLAYEWKLIPVPFETASDSGSVIIEPKYGVKDPISPRHRPIPESS